MLVWILNWYHGWQTSVLYGKELYIADGFVGYIPYVFLVLFCVLAWKHILSRPPVAQHIGQTAAFGMLALGLFSFATHFGVYRAYIDILLSEFLVLLAAHAFLFLAVFGLQFLKQFLYEVGLLLLLFIPFLLSSVLIGHFWEYSSRVTMWGLELLLPLTGVPYTLNLSTYLVRVDTFSAAIGPPCAGIHSLLAFTTIFFAALLLMWRRGDTVHWPKAGGAFVLGLLLVFVLNSIRILLILLLGAYYSVDFAVGLFHENIGALLLILFFFLYISFVLPRIIRR